MPDSDEFPHYRRTSSDPNDPEASSALLPTNASDAPSSDHDHDHATSSRVRTQYSFLFLCVLVAAFLLGSVIRTFTVHEEPREKTLTYGIDGGVILFGDSLIGYTADAHELIAKTRALSPYDLGYVDQGVGADTIQRMRMRLPTILSIIETHTAISSSPTLVLLLWDSDVCDIDERGWNPEDVPKIRTVYQNNIRFILSSILKTGAAAALAGPILCSESYKNQELDEYVELNRAVCQEFNIDYMNLRSAFLSAEAKGLHTTEDGEHPNNNGANIVADYFSKEIIKWQTSRTS